MYSRIVFENCDRRQLNDLLNVLHEIAHNSHGKAVLKAGERKCPIRVASLRKSARQLDLEYDEENYPTLIRWCREAIAQFENGYVSMTVIVDDDEGCFVDRFWIREMTVKLVGSTHFEKKLLLRDLEV